MSNEWEMPVREHRDGMVQSERLDDGTFGITVVDSGIEQTIVVTPYNAARLMAILGMVAGIPLTTAAFKKIEL